MVSTQTSIGDRLARDSGSQKVQHYLDVISHKIKIVGPTIEVKTKNSTDLSWVAATRSKSVEFFVFTSIVSELSSTGKASFHFHAALFGIRSLVAPVDGGDQLRALLVDAEAQAQISALAA